MLTFFTMLGLSQMRRNGSAGEVIQLNSTRISITTIFIRGYHLSRPWHEESRLYRRHYAYHPESRIDMRSFLNWCRTETDVQLGIRGKLLANMTNVKQRGLFIVFLGHSLMSASHDLHATMPGMNETVRIYGDHMHDHLTCLVDALFGFRFKYPDGVKPGKTGSKHIKAYSGGYKFFQLEY